MDWLSRSYYKKTVCVVGDAYEEIWLGNDEVDLSEKDRELLRSVLIKCHAAIALVCKTNGNKSVLSYCTDVVVV